MQHDWNLATRRCTRCHVPKHMVEDDFVTAECVIPVVFTCSPVLVADVKRHGTCIRGACPHIGANNGQ